MPVLNSQTVADKYPLSTGTKGAIIANVWNSRGGWFSVTGATAWVQLQYGELGQDHWVEEIFLGAGAFVVVPPNCRGLQFRNGVAGVTATVTAQIAQGDEPPLAISTIGQTNTVLVSSLNFQHNDLAVATEPTADYEDASFLQFSVVDDNPNTRVKIGLVNISLADKAPAAQQLFTGAVGSGAGSTAVGAAAGTDMTPGGLFASASAAATTSALTTTVTGDTVDYRFKVRADGQLTWGGGAGNADVTLARSAANQLDLGTTAQAGKLRLFGAVAGTLEISTLVTTDANPRFTLQADGGMNWGPGSAATDSTFLRLGVGVVGSTTTAISTGPASNAIGQTQPGSWLENSGRVLVWRTANSTPTIGVTLIGDTSWRFQVDTNGVLLWGPGNAAGDAGIQRYGVQQLGITTQPGYWRSLHANVGVIGGDGVNSSWAINDQGAASHCFFQSVAPSGFNSLVTSVIADAGGWRFLLTSDGKITWGSGAAVGDVSLARAVNSPSGTGSFLELTAGAGLGYGTGTGGTVTQITSLSTGVTINKPSGRINTFASALAANLNTVFTVTNSVVGANDTIIVNWANTISNNIPIWVSNVTAGAFNIAYTNLGTLTGSQSNAINFSVIKGASA